MALAYLLSPTFQFVNTAGRPLTGGYLEVYIAGSRDKYYCASDFNGTLHPFRIPLDSLGASVVLADDGHSYDVYVYNRYGSLSMSRYNVSPGGGGGGSVGTITSLDGSIIVTPTDDGVDLRVNSKTTTVMRCSATELTGDGDFQFAQVQRDGQGARVTSHNVIIDEGWWHYDATVRIRWQGSAESTQQVGLYSTNGSDTMDFDLSYPHSETVRLSGEIKALADGTQFVLGVTGIQAGMVAELVDFGIHTITSGGGAGGQYYQGTGILIDEADRIISVDPDTVQAKLTAGENVQISDNVISATDTTYSAGTGLNLSGTEFSADTTVLATKSDIPSTKDLVAGSNINIVEGSTTVTISATAAPQLQANWAETSTSSVQYIQNKPTIPVLPDTKDLVAGANVTITEGANSVTIAATDTTYTAGTNVQINGTTISATDTTYTAGSGLDLTGTEFSVDTNTVALKSDLPIQQQLVPGYSLPADAGKVLTAGSTTYWSSLSDYVTDTELSTILQGYQEALTAGSNIQISNGVISATDTTYTAGDGLTLNGTEFSVNVGPNLYIDPNTHKLGAVDTLPVAGYGLSNSGYNILDVDTSVIQTKLTAGTNVQINNDTISATDTTYTAGNGLSLSGTEFSVDTSVVATQADLADYTPTASLGAVALSNDYEDLSNLPTVKPMAAGNNISITEGASDITVACDITIGTVTV